MSCVTGSVVWALKTPARMAPCGSRQTGGTRCIPQHGQGKGCTEHTSLCQQAAEPALQLMGALLCPQGFVPALCWPWRALLALEGSAARVESSTQAHQWAFSLERCKNLQPHLHWQNVLAQASSQCPLPGGRIRGIYMSAGSLEI